MEEATTLPGTALLTSPTDQPQAGLWFGDELPPPPPPLPIDLNVCNTGVYEVLFDEPASVVLSEMECTEGFIANEGASLVISVDGYSQLPFQSPHGNYLSMTGSYSIHISVDYSSSVAIKPLNFTSIAWLLSEPSLANIRF